MNTPKESTSYWMVFRTIDSAKFLHLQSGSLKNLLNNYKLLFGKTEQYKSLKGQYKDKLRKFDL